MIGLRVGEVGTGVWTGCNTLTWSEECVIGSVNTLELNGYEAQNIMSFRRLKLKCHPNAMYLSTGCMKTFWFFTNRRLLLPTKASRLILGFIKESGRETCGSKHGGMHRPRRKHRATIIFEVTSRG